MSSAVSMVFTTLSSIITLESSVHSSVPVSDVIGKFLEHVSDTLDLREKGLLYTGHLCMMTFGVLFVRGMFVFIFIEQACCFWACYHPALECGFIFCNASICPNHRIQMFMNLIMGQCREKIGDDICVLFLYLFGFIECFTTIFLHTHSWLNWVNEDD